MHIKRRYWDKVPSLGKVMLQYRMPKHPCIHGLHMPSIQVWVKHFELERQVGTSTITRGQSLLQRSHIKITENVPCIVCHLPQRTGVSPAGIKPGELILRNRKHSHKYGGDQASQVDPLQA